MTKKRGNYSSAEFCAGFSVRLFRILFHTSTLSSRGASFALTVILVKHSTFLLNSYNLIDSLGM